MHGGAECQGDLGHFRRNVLRHHDHDPVAEDTPDHRQQECPILYFLDGTPLDVSGDGYIGLGLRPAEVEGIEVYQSATEVPARYRRSIKHCGVVLIWKRERH